MKVGVLETGFTPRPLVPRYGGYAAMVETLLGAGFNYQVFDVQAGDLPAQPELCDAYVVTGSSAGVYNPLPWIAPLEEFLRAARGKAALVGLCFGHQVMAEAFGGRVEKSSNGWGVGLEAYDVFSHEPWMDRGDRIALPAFHQDQVVEPPPGAVVLAGSAFTPFGLLSYGADRAISFQQHPEFSIEFTAALVRDRSEGALPKAVARRALQNLDEPNDLAPVGAGIRRFLRG
ncbi:MAG: type 1 glutamine amidotransferase [Caulobacteraceae bacterium]